MSYNWPSYLNLSTSLLMAHSQSALLSSIRYSLFMECTTNIVSSRFTHLFMCVRLCLFEVVPCVIALLPGRSATIYKHLFQLLDEQATDLNLAFEPEVITSDFETGLIKTVKQHVIMFFLLLISSTSLSLSLSLSTSWSFLWVDILDASSILPRAFIERSRS